MAEVVEGYKIKNKEEVSLVGLEGFGVDSEEHFYVISESGEKKQVKTLKEMGRLAMALAESNPNLEEMDLETESPMMGELRQQISQLNEQLAAERSHHAEVVTELKREHEAEMRELHEEFESFKAETARAMEGLQESVERLTQGLAERAVIPDSAREEVEEKLEEARGEAPATGTEVISDTEPAKDDPGRVKGAPGKYRLVEVVRDDQNRITDLRVVLEEDPVDEQHIRTIKPSAWVPLSGSRTIHEEVVMAPGAPIVEPVPTEVVEERERWWVADRGRAAAAAGALVVGAVLWEVVGERVFGFHDGGVTKREITNIINNHDAALQHKVNKLSSEVSKLALAEKAERSREHAQNVAIRNLKLHELRERVTGSGLYFGFRYPWDWAANKVGVYRASPWLHSLAAQAAEHGHKVRWYFSGRHQVLQIDGRFNTGYIVNVLSHFRGR